MTQPEAGETAKKLAVMVNEVDKRAFDKLADDRTWPHWRMFEELMKAFEAQPQLPPAN